MNPGRRRMFGLLVAPALVAAQPLLAAERLWLPNPKIDMAGHLAVAHEAAAHRVTRRVSEEEFIRLSKLPGTVILDARSNKRYEMLHVRGAVNLSFPDIAVDSLALLLPDRAARILIYCNNNFGASTPFPAKLAEASLNLSTYIALYTYGYRNVHELGPILDVRTTRLRLEGTHRSGAMSRMREGEPRV